MLPHGYKQLYTLVEHTAWNVWYTHSNIIVCRKRFHRSGKSVQLPPLQAEEQPTSPNVITPTYPVMSPDVENIVLSPLYNSEQNMCWLSAENKQDYYKLKPYYTHFLNCSPYEVWCVDLACMLLFMLCVTYTGANAGGSDKCMWYST